MKRIRAIIFDFDGVIIESVEVKGQIFAGLFRDYPKHVEKIVEYHLANGGLSRFHKFEYIHRNILGVSLTSDRKRLLGEMFSIMSSKIMSECPYVVGAEGLVKKYAKDVSLFVISGTPQEEIRDVIMRRGIDGYFRGVYGSPISKTERCANIMEEFGFSREDILFVGDSIEDYRGAHENGIDFIGRVREQNNNVFKGCSVVQLVRDLTELDVFLGRDCVCAGKEN